MKKNVFFGILKRKENSNPLKIIKISYFLKNKISSPFIFDLKIYEFLFFLTKCSKFKFTKLYHFHFF